MRVLVVGAGGVGRRSRRSPSGPAFERVVARRRRRRARPTTWSPGSAKPIASQPSAWTPPTVTRSWTDRTGEPDAVLNACDPRFNEPIFAAAFETRATYLDMAMTLSHPHPGVPMRCPGRCSATSSWPATSRGNRPVCSRSSGWAWSPASQTCSPPTPRKSCSRTSGSGRTRWRRPRRRRL